MPVAFRKAIFSCKLVCKDEVAGPRNVGDSPWVVRYSPVASATNGLNIRSILLGSPAVSSMDGQGSSALLHLRVNYGII